MKHPEAFFTLGVMLGIIVATAFTAFIYIGSTYKYIQSSKCEKNTVKIIVETEEEKKKIDTSIYCE